MGSHKVGDVGMVSQRPFIASPPREERIKIKASMGKKKNESFHKCRARSKTKVRAFEANGDMSHSEKNHVCDECRCNKVAGQNTEHYGIGFCFDHENVVGSTRNNNKTICELQKEAIMQGYPDKVYKYQTTDKYLEKVREVAEESGGMTDLREEMTLLRAKLQELVGEFEGGKRHLTEGHDKEGNVRKMTDATYYKLLGTLTTQVAKLTATNLTVTESDYVHVDHVNIWFAQVIRILQQTLEAEQKEVYKEIVDEIKLIPQMTKGRIK